MSESRRIQELERQVRTLQGIVSQFGVRSGGGGGGGIGIEIAADKTALDAIAPDDATLGYTEDDGRYYVWSLLLSQWDAIPRVFVQSTAPSTGVGDGDVWVDTTSPTDPVYNAILGGSIVRLSHMDPL